MGAGGTAVTPSLQLEMPVWILAPRKHKVLTGEKEHLAPQLL